MAERKRITKNTVDTAKPDEKDFIIWDTDVSGFGLRVRTGGSKIYVLKYRFNGRQRWYTIGKHGSPWNVEKARKRARRLLGMVADDVDPAEFRDIAKRDLTITELCDRYVEKGMGHKKASTIAIDKGRIERHIKPLLGKKKARSLTRADVKKTLNDIANGKTKADVKTGKHGRAIITGGKGTANKAVNLLSAILSYAVDEDIVDENPAIGVKRFAEGSRERFLTAKELKRLGKTLTKVQKEDSELPGVVTAIRLLTLTGARKSEIVTAKWEYLDAQLGQLRLPDSKTGAKPIRLGPPALELLQDTPRVAKNPYICPGTKEGRPIGGLQKAWERIRNKAKLQDVRLHDLRHSFASVSAGSGESLLIIGAMLGHKRSTTTERYSHLADDPVKAATDRTSKQIDAMMKGKGAKVIKMKKGAR